MMKGIFMTIETKISVDPDLKKLRTRVNEARKDLKESKPAWKRVSIFLDQWVQQNFRTEGGKVGGWSPFSEFNLRALLDPSAKLLQDTGRLRLSFVPFATKNDAGIGSDLPYAEKHEEGEGALPVRRMLPKGSEVKKDVREILEDFVGVTLKRVERRT
jgi:phage gpG-like protein